MDSTPRFIFSGDQRLFPGTNTQLPRKSRLGTRTRVLARTSVCPPVAGNIISGSWPPTGTAPATANPCFLGAHVANEKRDLVIGLTESAVTLQRVAAFFFRSPLLELASVVVRLDHVASFIVNVLLRFCRCRVESSEIESTSLEPPESDHRNPSDASCVTRAC